MSTEKDLQEQIEDYLAGTMDDSAKRTFERRLESDPDAAQALLLNQEVHRAIKDPKALQLEESLRIIGDDFVAQYEEEKAPEKNRIPLVKNYRWIAAVAAILICTFSAWWLWNHQPTKLSNQELYAEFYEAYPAQTNSRTLDTQVETTFLQAQKAYQASDYSTAIPLFKRLLEEEKLSPEFRISILFYKGQAHLAAQEIAPARQTLESIDALPSNSYTRPTKWYLALIALQNNDIEQAKKFLLDAQKGVKHGRYYHQAQSLYEIIK